MHPPPPSLFSTVISVSLGGLVTCGLLSNILASIALSTLRHLCFNNIQTFAEENWDRRNMSQQTIDAHRCTSAGPAFGFLRDWTGQCPTLRSFHYMSTAQYFPRDIRRRYRTKSHMQPQDEDNRYLELALFIDSVRPTLRELLFEHGPNLRSITPTFRIGFPWNTHRDTPLPMDVYFNTRTFPILISTWPRLEKIIVRGISHWKPIHLWSDFATAEDHAYLDHKIAEYCRVVLALMEAAPEGCEVIVSDEATRPFYRLQGKGPSIVEGHLNRVLLDRIEAGDELEEENEEGEEDALPTVVE